MLHPRCPLLQSNRYAFAQRALLAKFGKGEVSIAELRATGWQLQEEERIALAKVG